MILTDAMLLLKVLLFFIKEFISMQHITVARGDGIGPEIMDAVISILNAASVPLKYDDIQIGKTVYEAGHSSGIAPESWDTLIKNGIFLKAPITTPQGGGYKSLNVTIRKTLGLYANIRPFKAFSPYVKTHYPDLDMVIVRENEEDLYAGIEHQQTQDVIQCLKLISIPGCEKIIRYAFEYAVKNGRKKITCMSKDNIMKQTDGAFHKLFVEISKEYPAIETEHMIIDIGSAKIAANPERFDVIVTLNLYGDIISDIAAEVAGSVGLAGSVNCGDNFAMYEAIHGSAPDIAGKDMANPSGLLQGALMMLVDLGLITHANTIQNAWLKTLEDGIHTGDIYQEHLSKKRVGTTEFSQEIIKRLGQNPQALTPANFKIISKESTLSKTIVKKETPQLDRKLVGIDVFSCETPTQKTKLFKALEKSNTEKLKLKLVTNRGTKVFPDGNESTFCVDHWRSRFVAQSDTLEQNDIINLLSNLTNNSVDIIKTENLYTFNGERGYSLAQGE